jgi:hypothetical protein
VPDSWLATEKPELLIGTDESRDYKWVIADDVTEGSVVEIDISREYSKDVKGCFATYTVSLANEVADVTFESVKSGNSAKDKGDWYFDGTKYKLADCTLIGKTSDENEEDFTNNYEKHLGDNYNLYLDRNGYVVFALAVNSAFDDYMLVLDTNGVVSSTLDTAKAYALVDTDSYKTLSVNDEIDSAAGLYNKKGSGFGDTSVEPVGSLVAYKLDENGKLDDWENAGNAVTLTANSDGTVVGTDKNRVGGKIQGYDDDTYKINIGGQKYLLDDKTKVFLFTKKAVDTTKINSVNDNQETTDNMKEGSKVVTASELAEVTADQVKAGGEYAGLQAVAVTLSGSKSSILEAIAIYDPTTNGNYFNAATGNEYPAIISSITQSIVSGSSSKYSYEVSLYVNGEKKSLKTEDMTSSNFYSNILDQKNGTETKAGSGKYTDRFNDAKSAKNMLAWVSINGDDQVTKIIPVTENSTYAGSDAADQANVVTMTRAIVAAKNTKGVTFIPMDDGSGNGWVGEQKTNSDGKYNVVADLLSDGNGGSTKTQLSNYAAFASDAAFYTLNVRPAGTDVNNALGDSFDGDYTVEVGSASDVLVSTINGLETDVYYIADIFFDDDADISAMVIYTKDITTIANSDTKKTNNAVLSQKTVEAGASDVVTVTKIPTGAKVTVNDDDVSDSVSSNTYTVDASYYATAGTVTIKVSATGYETKTLSLVVTEVGEKIPNIDTVEIHSWIGGENVQIVFYDRSDATWLSDEEIANLFKTNGLTISDIHLTYQGSLDSESRDLNIEKYAFLNCATEGGDVATSMGNQAAHAYFLKLYTGEKTDLNGTLSITIGDGKTIKSISFRVPGSSPDIEP